MAGDSFALNSLGEVIFGILFITVLSSFFFLAHKPELLYSELETTEIAAVSSIIPKSSTVSITLKEERKLIFQNNNEIILSVNEEYNEDKFKKIPEDITLKQQENKIIIIKNG